MQWVPARTPVQRAFTRLGLNLALILVACVLAGLFFVLVVVIGLRMH